jgi:transcriptional regulator with AAA-type ATPase domain
MSADLENPFIRDFFEQKRGTVFCLSEAIWRARDARAVQEILSRFPPRDFDVQAVYAKARQRGTFDMKELRTIYAALKNQNHQGEPTANDFLKHLEEEQATPREDKDRLNKGELQVPVKGPIIIVGRPESYASYHASTTEFNKLVEDSGYRNGRFHFLSDDPVDPEDKTKENPKYRIIEDRRTGSEYHHRTEEHGEIKDYAVIYATRLEKPFHTHGRLVTVVGGTGTIGTLGAAKLMMDSEELLKACPELRKRVRWPVELLLAVHVRFKDNDMGEVWDVSLKDVQVPLPVSRGFAPREKPPGAILKDLQEKAAKNEGRIDYTTHWHPPGLPLAVQLVGAPDGLVEDFVKDLRARASDTYPLLLLGESGVGKEIAARLFFLFNAFWRATTAEGWRQTRGAAERRKGQLEGKAFVGLPKADEMSFVAVNCGAFARDLINSELFGHVAGAFTGADHNRAGAFLSAGSGTLFLDEIHALSVEQQAVFLRALQEREVKPVGMDGTVAYGCNVVAASNVELGKLTRRFRGDLLNRFHRLTIPPLNDRLEDVLVHAVQVLFELSRKEAKKAFSVRMTERFIRLLLAQDFRRRNFRWLASLVTAAYGERDGQQQVPRLRGEFLPEDLGRQLPDGTEGAELEFRAEFPDDGDFDFRSLPAVFMKLGEEPVSNLTTGSVATLARHVERWFKSADGLRSLTARKVIKQTTRECQECHTGFEVYQPTAPIYWYLLELAREQNWALSELTKKGQHQKARDGLLLHLWHHLDLRQGQLGRLFGATQQDISKAIGEAHRSLS